MTTTPSDNGLLKALLKPGGSKDQLLAKMTKLPEHATHVGIANTDLGLTVVVGSELHPPSVWDPRAERWVQLITKTTGGVLNKSGRLS